MIMTKRITARLACDDKLCPVAPRRQCATPRAAPRSRTLGCCLWTWFDLFRLGPELGISAPEQTGFTNRSVDSHSDFYSLGVTLYRMLTGALPFAAADPLEWVHCHIARRPALSEGVPFETERRVPGKDGKYRWYVLRYNPFRDEQGRLVRWYATGTDIEDRKLAEQRLQNENIVLREEVDRFSMFEEIIGSCEPMRQVLKQVTKVASSGSTVLILGETGTGKELEAQVSDTTAHYARVDIATLQQIAQPWPGFKEGK
jgi:hypothetical protein